VKYDLLDQVGQHAKNGVAVKQVFFTKKPNALYAITAGWPGKELVLRHVRVPANATVTMLGVPGLLKAEVVGESLIVPPELRIRPRGGDCHGRGLAGAKPNFLPERASTCSLPRNTVLVSATLRSREDCSLA